MYHDYGTAGQTFEIIERDLTEVMKEKIKTVDWMRKKEQALENFWSRRKTPALPPHGTTHWKKSGSRATFTTISLLCTQTHRLKAGWKQ